ncbi:hypothetical protein FGO68_gene4033 [Halteria grandinella]|uniref:USP domain-containing protein n=1 Tax=Halteria grandinella TaxID=5974 RepID=A0A8J8NGI1_HALGN|nr:hypothetical protein FGO68_gene4033 [Halteria grandinella]
MEEKKPLKDLSMNKLMSIGGTHPGDVTNRFLLMESKEFYHNRTDDRDITNFALKEDLIYNRDYLIVPRSVWRIFKQDYEGHELMRWSIVKDKYGRLHRDPVFPRIRVAIMRRGDRLKYPKILNIQRKLTFQELKGHLKNIFQFLNEASLNEIRLWILNDDMQLEDFIDSFNSGGISDNMSHTYEFPGLSLEKLLDHHVDEYKQLQSSTKTILIEVKLSKYQWLFNLDPHDSLKYYRPAENDLQKIPYILGEDGEVFFDSLFSYNLYWRNRNNQLNRDYHDITLYENNKLYEEQILNFQKQSKSQPSIPSKCQHCKKVLTQNPKSLPKCKHCHSVTYCSQDCLNRDLRYHHHNVDATVRTVNRQPQLKLTPVKKATPVKKQANKRKRVQDETETEEEEELNNDEPKEESEQEEDLETEVAQRYTNVGKGSRRSELKSFKVLNNEDDTVSQEGQSKSSRTQTYSANTSKNNTNQEVSSQESSESDYAEKAASRRREAKLKAKNDEQQTARKSIALKAPMKTPGNQAKITESTNSSSSQSQNALVNSQKSENKQDQSTNDTTVVPSDSPKFDMSFIVGHGLSNIGNTCYINSIIQALACIPLFRKEVYSLAKGGEEDQDKKPVTFSLFKLLEQIKDKSIQSTTFSPQQLKNALAKSDPLFAGSEQFDAHEFLIYFQDFLITENFQEKELHGSLSPSSTIPTPAPKAGGSSQEYLERMPQNFISKLFGGLLKQEIICKKCNHSSMIYEPFNVLSVPIDFEQDKSSYARIKIIYIYDTDRYKKYEFQIKPASYSIKEFHEKIKQKIEQDRKDIKSGKKTFILADLVDDFTRLQKVFLEDFHEESGFEGLCL